MASRAYRTYGRRRASDDAFLRQGGAQSIEDAFVLAGCIAEGQDRPLDALARFVKMRLPRTAWMQSLARREEELYQMSDAAAINARNNRMRSNRFPETATFPAEQERLYGYDAEIELQKSVDRSEMTSPHS